MLEYPASRLNNRGHTPRRARVVAGWKRKLSLRPQLQVAPTCTRSARPTPIHSTPLEGERDNRSELPPTITLGRQCGQNHHRVRDGGTARGVQKQVDDNEACVVRETRRAVIVPIKISRTVDRSRAPGTSHQRRMALPKDLRQRGARVTDHALEDFHPPERRRRSCAVTADRTAVAESAGFGRAELTFVMANVGRRIGIFHHRRDQEDARCRTGYKNSAGIAAGIGLYALETWRLR